MKELRLFMAILAMGVVLGGCASGERRIAEAKGAEIAAPPTKVAVVPEKKEVEVKEVQKEAKSDQVSCQKDSEIRKLKRTQLDSGGCEVVYTKGDESRVIASAKNELQVCERVESQVQEKLEHSGFECE